VQDKISAATSAAQELRTQSQELSKKLQESMPLRQEVEGNIQFRQREADEQRTAGLIEEKRRELMVFVMLFPEVFLSHLF
jgi:hypothetical protein